MAKLMVRDDSAYGWTEIEVTDPDTVKVQQKEDVSAVLAQIAEERNRAENQYIGKGTQTSAMKIGSVSPLMMMRLIEEGIWWDDKALEKWFNDLDNYLWRVSVKGASRPRA